MARRHSRAAHLGRAILALGLLAGAARGDSPREAADGPCFRATDRLNRRLDALLAPRRAPASRESGRKRGGKGESGAKSPESDESRTRRPDWLAPLFDPINPARLHKLLDERFGFDTEDETDKPEAPEIPEPVFIEFTRPLGALKYESELNYLLVAPTGKTPMAQFLEFEYVFSDWNAAKFEMEFSQGALETIEPGYQRTLGVGEEHNWVHGFQVNPEIFMRTGFIGGTAAYILGWKPEEKSPYSVAAWLGANRSQFDAEPSRTFPQVGGGGLTGLALPHQSPADASQRGPGAWRTMANLDFWYTLSPSLSVGMENDAFVNRRFGEYLVLPHVNWQPSDHIFVQAGAGYYQLGHEHQAVIMMHVNLVNTTSRKPRAREEGGGR